MKREKVPYSSLVGYGENDLFCVSTESMPLETCPSTALNKVNTMDFNSSDSSDSEDNDFPEDHVCGVYRCSDPHCFSCDFSSSCFNCSHCGINRDLLLPCMECLNMPLHSVSVHKETRCSHHKEFPSKFPPQFTAVQPSSDRLQSKFSEAKPDGVSRQDHKAKREIDKNIAISGLSRPEIYEPDEAPFCDKPDELLKLDMPVDTPGPLQSLEVTSCIAMPFKPLKSNQPTDEANLQTTPAPENKAPTERRAINQQVPAKTSADSQKLTKPVEVEEDTYLGNFVPRPLVPDQYREDCVARMDLLDRMNCFHEQLTNHNCTTARQIIYGIDKYILNEDDVNITGRYDEIFKFWDRNKIFVQQKILAKKPETLVKLFNCEDLPLVFEALYALNRSARVSKTLQEGCGQTKAIVPLLDVLNNNDHDGARRLAIYILSMAVKHPQGRCVFFELGSDTVKQLYQHFLTDELYAMRRAYSLVMANLLEDSGVLAVLSNAVTFESTFSSMCEMDPDFQLYLMKMVFYAMHDIEGREKIVNLPEFRLTPILSSCLSKKSEVRRIALDLLDACVSFCKQDVIIKTFRGTRGIKVLSKILRKPYVAYSHPVVLKIYETLAENPDSGPAEKEGNLANVVEFIDTLDDPQQIANTLRVLVKMTRDPATKEVLALTNVIGKVSPLIVHTNEELAQSVLMIIELMAAKGSPSFITQQLVKADPMVDLLWVVGSENRGWDTRVIALRCIIALINLSPFFGECYTRCHNSINVVKLLCHQAKFLTTYSKTLLVQVLSALSKSKRNYEFLIRNKTVKALLYSFKCFGSFESQLYAHSVGLLAYMMKDRRAVIQFSNVKRSWDLLAKKFMEKTFISADILMNLMFLVIDLTDNFEIGAKAFIGNGFIRWLIDLEDKYPEIATSIAKAIDSIIRNYFSLKFAHHGFLNYQDFTNKSLFFVTRNMYNVYKNENPFPIFDKGISNKLKLEKPLLYFNLPLAMRGASADNVGDQLKIETSDDFSLYTAVSRSDDSVKEEKKDDENKEKFVPLEADPKLDEIFLKAKSAIATCANRSVQLMEKFCISSVLIIRHTPSDLRQKRIDEIIGIASIVVTVLTGYDPDIRVSRQMQDIYLDTLVEHLGSNIFPFGRLVMGHKLERASLFKVLADAFDIPCWLYRTGQLAWNEVYIPPAEGYQGGDLASNYVVDLMSPKPQLFRNKTQLAKTYITDVDN